ncbi:hypothetical protein [Solibaculum intestinale]|uniref:TPM domain-containing protein n=1 Tax=Solibaculum intestinale TaxID=3133165 RepID=A0ABV1E1E3_9FIRM
MEIVRAKSKGPMDEEVVYRRYRSYLGDDARSRGNPIVYIVSDDYGRAIYTGFGKHSKLIVMLFNPDGTYDDSTGTMDLTSFVAYQDQLKAFKDRNHWNQPLT